MKHPILASLASALLFCLSAQPAFAQGHVPKSSEIIAEVAHTHAESGRILNVWWLPPEYWVASARALQMASNDIEEVRRVFDDYLIVAAVEVEIGAEGKPVFTEIVDFVNRSTITVNRKPVEVLREVNPRVAELAPKLIYPLKASLSTLGEGLRLLPINNTEPSGKATLMGADEGELRMDYRLEEGHAPLELRWRAPLTSVAGAQKCPQGGEDLEANWDYCPFHGSKLKKR